MMTGRSLSEERGQRFLNKCLQLPALRNRLGPMTNRDLALHHPFLGLDGIIERVGDALAPRAPETVNTLFAIWKIQVWKELWPRNFLMASRL